MFFPAAGLRTRVAITSLFVITLTACGGGGGGGGALPSAIPVGTAAPTATPMPMAIVSQNGTNIELTGTINGMIVGGFRIQGGSGVGYVHILTNSATAIVGPAPFVGENVDVVGVGTPSTSITATKISQFGVVATPAPTPTPSATPARGVTATPFPTPTPLATLSPSPVPSGAAIPVPSGVIIASGQIGSVSGTKVSVQTGRGCGWMNVTVNASTAYFDGTPGVGQYVAFTGAGTRCSSITSAATVSISASPMVSGTVSGTVAGTTPYGFTLNTSSGPVPVAMASSTIVFGSTLMVGSNVTVTALGTTSTGLTATQIAVAAPPTPTPNPSMSPTPTPGPIAMAHVQNFAYIYGYAGTPTTVPLGSMAPWVDWTMTDIPHESAVRAAGIKAQIYTNYWRNYTTDNPTVGYTDLAPGGAHAAAEARDCSNNPVTDPNYGGGYEADPRSTSAFGHAQTVVNYRLGEFASNYDALYADDTGTVEGLQTPCGYTQSAWDQAVNTVHSALGIPMFINALGVSNPVAATDLLQPVNVLGAMCELCYTRNGPAGDVAQTGSQWTNNENAEIATINMRKIFWLYARATGAADSETAIRTYAYASFLLTYDPSYAMFQEALSTPSGFPVMPETAFIPMNPVTTAADVSGYQGPGGVYFREFAHCYYAHNYVSNCAVAVNASAPGSGTAPIPSTSYNHTLQLQGSGVLDGGTIGFNGPAVTSLAPGTAAILLP